MEPDLLHYYQTMQSYDWTDVADHWRGPETILHRWRSAIVRRMIRRFDDASRWLDVGCGTGLCTRLLPAGSVGVDINPRNIAKLQQHAPHIEGIVVQAEHLPFSADTFSRVLCTEVLEHFRDAVPVLREIRRVMQPGGILIATTPNDALLWKFRCLSSTCTGAQHEPFHREFRKRDIVELFANSGWTIRSCVACCARMQWCIVAQA